MTTTTQAAPCGMVPAHTHSASTDTTQPSQSNPDAQERLAGLAALLGDIANSILSTRALVRELDDAHGRAIADALSVAGWMADYGAQLAGDSGVLGRAEDWFLLPYTHTRLGGVEAAQQGDAA